MGLHVGAVTFDAGDASLLSRFWADALGATARPARDLAGAYVVEPSSAGPLMLFLPVPEPKTAKNRCHLDLHTADYADDLARLEALGAAVVAHHDEAGRWVVLHDPEGNEFCLVEDVATPE
jgi:predicted enzyme related to lactoylglutathione lyase